MSSSKWVGSSSSGRESENRIGDSCGASAGGAAVGDVGTGNDAAALALAAAAFAVVGLSERTVGLLLRCVVGSFRCRSSAIAVSIVIFRCRWPFRNRFGRLPGDSESNEEDLDDADPVVFVCVCVCETW